jgi:uncharacterized protein (TIGR00661 family)
MDKANRKHILVAPLDWGLGHATRCIPVINCLVKNGCQVSVAGSGPSLALLKEEFPQHVFHELPAYNIVYSSNRFFLFKLIVQVPRILNAIRQERKQLQKFVSENQVDAIISDNRYGCHVNGVYSVLLIHQLNLILPSSLGWAKQIIDFIHHHFIKKFDTCWVPDFPGSIFSGKLSQSKKINAQFVGLLSRFTLRDEAEKNGLVVGLVSGPEPQRKNFEKLLISEFKNLSRPSLIVRGLPNHLGEESNEEGIMLIAHSPTNDLEKIVAGAEIVIARSGYSTIMDLQALGKNRVIFVPTPGQTEQEYLADEMKKRDFAFIQTQDRFNLVAAIEESKKYTGFVGTAYPANLLNDAVTDLLSKI